MEDPKQETTLLLIKPDGVKRGLVGEILKRIEMRGLKVIGLKMFHAGKEHAHSHYPQTEQWLRAMGEKSLDNYRKYDKNPMEELGTDDALEIGKQISKWNVDFLTSGPMVAIAIRGIHAVDMVRKIVGNTLPSNAEMGTIRGDFSVDSPILANAGKRALHNVVHASGDLGEAERELKHWFEESEIWDYKRAEEDIMF
ncbi:MAG: nucleoside-diphosphate kinase [Candidatus Spechtbacteria bacterium RIFCSPLOWO2_02_FULL_38_8]|uniref:nucleoside-diphosphate kinase n=1 Tax=Candidatus Spechtbacteria bacterium RIFCSPLOWO2_02_FULL_38_8 TaxID=1802164 RepID=A0A1G2HFY5_9BACT|nr:MAG: nucleoside-diphosphate kinase [Candidatus Spechtbacteria bacterium RIFCSPLOWO2_02_FULL_38_8]